MEKFYSITPAQAALIGKFTFAENQAVDPFVNEQEDGNFLMSEDLYKKLKHLPEFKKFDWSGIAKIDKDKIKTKDKGLV